MPEGDTVRRLADRISARFVGERCIRSIARDPRIVHLDLAGSTLVETDAVGKWLLLRFDDGRTVFGHLRMDGHLDLGRRSPAPEWKRRLEVEFESGWMTAVDMPVIGVVATADEESVVGHLGPDLCGPSVPDIEAIVARLVEQTRSSACGRRSRPAQRGRLRQRLRGRDAIHRGRVTAPAGRLDRWVGPARAGRECAHPHQCRARPPEHHRSPPPRGAPLGLRAPTSTLSVVLDTA